MKKYFLKCLITITQLVMSSCVSGSDYYKDRVEPFLNKLESSYEPKMFDGVMEPSFPNLAEDKKTLEGIDSNKDGVRDDMEIFINRNFETWVERDNFKNEVKRTVYFYQNYKKMSIEEYVKYISNSSIDLNCIFYGIKYLNLTQSSELQSYRSGDAIYNTKEREKAFSYFSGKMAGRAYGDGYGDEIVFETCKKKIDSKIQMKNEGK